MSFLVQELRDFELLVALGLVTGYSLFPKVGRNEDIDPGSVPEDIWDGGGLYTGFPTIAPETVQVFSSSAADTAAGTGARTVQITGLGPTGLEDIETVVLNGVTPVNTVKTWKRVHFVIVLTAGSGGSNAGTLTCRYTTTTTVVFSVMSVGLNQSQVGAITIPSNKTGILRRIFVNSFQTSTLAGALVGLFIRPPGGVFQCIGQVDTTIGSAFTLELLGGLVLAPSTDIVLRVLSVTDVNSRVTVVFSLILKTP